ncbi:type I restriction endonuclease subunit R [Xylella fastidiosa]|uniref:type I restriction endonuclease subunit R n=1 Tax=Xylella fastidiosa TaxID=2371 RepID=UPI00097B9104|nr:type I restriction endonuclease subunit R [Xylella fastidiosa]MDC6412533.1 type I restriction endonuclease subunit R [Xylella fastidiosa subsp. multiplex]MDD0863212.1 type I restriction endonuclease subunit R [Xylella fastidiosa subsp. multiplex]MDD0865303.1 type I restriction endonuclease subunit R [Xylella fastidiosa subsp. multiplex]MDD0872133.1 type I restriction endonuclease subunit R [Xylella fastidiosa subsp. multiplex]MDD0874219.1 type I restriction endonuclease subunit R [Xylella f
MSEPIPPFRYAPIVFSEQSTIVAEFVPEASGVREAGYQSEAELEAAFIKQLQGQAYEYLPITSEAALLANLRRQLEKLNKVTLSDAEWEGFFSTCIAGAHDGIVQKTARIQEDHVQVLKRDDGTTKNMCLLDKVNIHNNTLQVINQYAVEGARANRYDVTVLVNGLPMVHVELKRRGVDIREAFNQINRYQRDSFWAGSGLFDYVQLFVISNGTLTKYYSNTVRAGHVEEQSNKRSKSKTSNSFSFAIWWADAKNQPITELTSFTKTFFAKHSLLNVLTKYCVFNANRKLLVMRPYQIVAAERILQRIVTATHQQQLGTVAAGGYIWHTTGSGKTLTSFKVAQLACGLGVIDKVLFVVDRKDLDYQTMREYESFEKGAANSNTSTAVLQRQLEDSDVRIIITTIQKLSRFVAKHKQHPVYGAHVVVIFDECHRSQFGDMHTKITRAFQRYHLFGFTGTPIFAENAGSTQNPMRRTTQQTFGDTLHTYTIVDAINDKTVLPFRIDYINTIKSQPNIKDKKVAAIDTERALLAPERIRQIVSYIREHFDQKTKRASIYRHEGKRLAGFNSLLATASIDAAKRYYAEFMAQQKELPEARRLKVGLIYSVAANEGGGDGGLGEEEFETEGLDQDSRNFLEAAIQDYNRFFDPNSNFDTTEDKFQNYYKDVSKQLKNRKLDILIVVNMFLTGFDASTLNTLWVDKRLKAHGLIQAYSRTNRILNSVKSYGNIVSFRNLEQETNEALALFGNKDAKGIVLLRPYAEYYKEYEERVGELVAAFPLGKAIVGEAAQKAFITLFGSILRLKNILTAFDDFGGQEILTEREFQDYQSLYLNLYAEFRSASAAEKESINDDVVFEIELIKQVEINVDFILLLVEQYVKKKGTGEDKDIRATIERAINSSPSLRNKKDLIEQFVDSVSMKAKVDAQWQAFVAVKQSQELEGIIAEENLNAEAAREFIGNAFRDGSIPATGTAITKVLPPVSRFSKNNGHAAKKQAVLDKLATFFERYFGLV